MEGCHRQEVLDQRLGSVGYVTPIFSSCKQVTFSLALIRTIDSNLLSRDIQVLGGLSQDLDT